MLYTILTRYTPLLFAALSTIAILREAFLYGFSVPISLLIDFYGSLTGVLFGWMAPYILQIGNAISNVFGITFFLGDHWKDIFLILALYYMRDVANFVRAKDVVAVLLSLVFGVGFALASSVAMSSIDIDSNSYSDNLLGCLYPLWGLALYRTIRGVWASVKYRESGDYFHDLKMRLRSYYTEILIGIALASHILLNNVMLNARASFLTVTAILIFNFAIWNIYKGWIGSRNVQSTKESRINDFWGHGNTRLGVDIILVYVFTVVFIISNAGLKLIGL